MIRALLYLLAAGAIWLTEGFLFSHYLGFRVWQTVLMVMVYVGLFSVALRLLLAAAPDRSSRDSIAAWRQIAVAPMLAVIVGSFLSMPILLLIAALGKVV